MMSSERTSVRIMITVICAALYAVGAYLTAYIPSPWGVGQFRPAVVIPTFFAVVFGPIPAGIGAALGTLLADSIKHGYLYPGSLIAAVPGNFLGFFLIGKLLWKKFSWNKFILISNFGLLFANAVVAILYVFAYKLLYQNQYTSLPFEALVVMATGLTLFWFVTKLPFVLLITPPLIQATVSAFPFLVTNDLKEILKKGLPERELGISMLGPGILLLLVAVLMGYSGAGAYMIKTFGVNTKNIIEIVSYFCSTILIIIGGYFFINTKKK
ncbi:ECF transporter S component [Candidatus Bathyarchaeota archaeon]|nr:ECF transporter S component [Candidatus Bathyarchaeota archaeon]